MFSIKDAELDTLNYIQIPEIFELYRFVDPVTNQVYDYKSKTLLPICQKCYEIWHRDIPCANCISMRAIREQRIIFKLEYMGDATYFIVAIPVHIQGNDYALELVNNVTDSLAIYNSYKKDNSRDLSSIIHDLNYVVTHDIYTDLLNKSYAESQLARTIVKAQKEKLPLTIIVIDIDHFKSVNDTYGHMMGDQVILKLSKLLKDYVEGNEKSWVARIGGDEFLMVFCDRHIEEIREFSANLSNIISKHVFKAKESKFSISVSMGVKAYCAEEDTPTTFLDHVDQLMYTCKKKKIKE